MQDHEYDEFVAEIQLLAERLPKQLSARLIEAYFDTLKKYHFGTVKFVMFHYPKSHRKFPSEAELLESVKANSRAEEGERNQISDEKSRKLKALEDEFTLICKQICANNVNSNFALHPIMRKLLEKNSEAVNHVTKDYSRYKTEFTNEQLFEKQRAIEKLISIEMMSK